MTCSRLVQFDNNETISANSTGLMVVYTTVNGVPLQVSFENVVYAPDVMFNLIMVLGVRRNKFSINVEDENRHPSRGKIALLQRLGERFQMVVAKTHYGVY